MMVERLSVSISYFVFLSLCQEVNNHHKVKEHVSFAGEGHSTVSPRIRRAAQTNPLLNHLHDLRTQAPEIPAPTLWQTQRNL